MAGAAAGIRGCRSRRVRARWFRWWAIAASGCDSLTSKPVDANRTGGGILRAGGRRVVWAMLVLVLASACGRTPPAEQAAGPAPAREQLPASVAAVDLAAGIEAALPTPARWVAPPVDLALQADSAQWRQQAAQALEEGRLYEDAEAAVPIYLALLAADPDDTAAARGLGRARRADTGSEPGAPLRA